MLLFAACGGNEPAPGTTDGGDTAGETTAGEDTAGTDGDTAGETGDGGTGETGDGGTGETGDGGTTGETGDGGTTGEDGGETPPAPTALCATAEATDETEVVFAEDKVRDAAIAELIKQRDLEEGATAVTCGVIEELRGLTVNGVNDGMGGVDDGISDLGGLENATGLLSVDFSNNEIEDLTPLSGLTELTLITMPNNQIEDLSPLAGLENLNEIRLAFNRDLDDTNIGALADLAWPGDADKVSLIGTDVTEVGAAELVTVEGGVEEVTIGPDTEGSTTVTGGNGGTDEGGEEDETPPTL